MAIALPNSSQSLVWLAGIALLAGCPANRKMGVPPGAPARIADSPPAGQGGASGEISDNTGGSETGDGTLTEPGALVGSGDLLADGETCTDPATCESGVCEGGCDAANPSVCVSRNRICTMDIVTFCSCEGETFTASSTCVGRRFQAREACK